jgi:hypothetical protein
MPRHGGISHLSGGGVGGKKRAAFLAKRWRQLPLPTAVLFPNVGGVSTAVLYPNIKNGHLPEFPPDPLPAVDSERLRRGCCLSAFEDSGRGREDLWSCGI